MDKFKDKVNGWKNFAEQLLKDDKRVYIKDLNGDYYFAEILLVGDEKLTIKCFAPDTRAGKTFYLSWALIYRFDEYKEAI
jgi:hypothetical protein